jgi:hypothetical protein
MLLSWVCQKTNYEIDYVGSMEKKVEVMPVARLLKVL